MPTPWRTLVVAVVAALVLSPVVAQPPTPCSAVPFFDHDAVAENLLGISPGFVGEYCQHLDLTPFVTGSGGTLCTNNGSYFVVETLQGTTRNGGGPQSILGDVKIRRAFGAIDLDHLISAAIEVPLGMPPPFPSYAQSEVLPFDPDAARALLEEAGWVLGDDGIFVCRGWDGDNSTQALPADVGAGAVHDIYATFDAGEIWELVQSFPGFEQFRSVDMGVTIAPIGGSLTGSQVVPPSPTTARGTVGVWEQTPGAYRLRAVHRLGNPLFAELRSGAFGENGPVIFDYSNAESAIDEIYSPPNPTQFANELDAGRIYLLIENALGERIRTNLARAERRIEPAPSTYSIRVGLSHPGTVNCYDVQYVGGGDASLQFDSVEELPVSFANGTVPGFDEVEMPRGGDFFNFQIAVAVRSGPGELFPSGFFEPGTGTPLTDGCIDVGVADPLDLSRYGHVQGATLDSITSSGFLFPPEDVTDSFQTFRQKGTWRSDARIDLSGAADLGIDRVRLRVDTVDGIFGDPFKNPDTGAWDVTVNPP